MRDSLLSLAGHGDGHVLAVAVALLLAILTGRSDLCIAGVFGAGNTRSLAVLLIALSCELVSYTKENVAAKAKADQISDLAPPTQTLDGYWAALRKARAKLMQQKLMFDAVIAIFFLVGARCLSAGRT